MYIDQLDAWLSGRKRKDGKREDDRTLTMPGGKRNFLNAYHHSLPPFPTESQTLCACFLHHKADLCAVSISPTESRCGTKKTTC